MMRLGRVLFLACFLCVLPFTIASASQEEDEVLTLTSPIFEDAIKAHSHLLVAFYDPSCSHCKNIEPDFPLAAKILSDDKSIKLAKIDASREPDLVKALQLQSYPTIFLFRNGFRILYTGGLTTDLIVDWMRDKAEPPVKIINNFQDLQKFRDTHKNRTQVIGFFKDLKSKEYEHLAEASYHPLLDKIKFGATADPELVSAQGEESANVNVRFPSEDEEQTFVFAKHSMVNNSLLPWLFDNAFSFVGNLVDNVQRYYHLQRPLCGLFFDPVAPESPHLLSVFKDAATSFKGKASFTYANGSIYLSRFPKMGYTGPLPVIALSDFHLKKTIFYPLSATSQTKELSEWIGGVLDGSIPFPRKSSPPPEKNDGPVYIVTGDTFRETVLDPTKDVLLEIYAPWCGHCKSLAPIYEKLGTYFSKYETIRIAKLDGTTDDHNIPNLEGYPTLIFFPAKEKRVPIMYNNPDRTFESLVEFVKSSASFPLLEPTEKSGLKDEL